MKDWRFAFTRTLPVLFGYVFLGLAFGVLMQQAGFSPLWALAASVFIYAGSMQFLLVELLSAGASLPLAAAMTLLLNSRHLFYGLSFIEKFRHLGPVRHYLVFALSDETYSVLCGLTEQQSTAGKMGRIALLDQLYWVIGSVLGGVLGTVLPFDTTGIEFSMTALFLVIFLEQWLSAKSRLPAVVGLASALVFLLLLGPDRFILPSLIVTVAALLAARRPIQERMGGAAA